MTSNYRPGSGIEPQSQTNIIRENATNNERQHSTSDINAVFKTKKINKLHFNSIATFEEFDQH